MKKIILIQLITFICLKCSAQTRLTLGEFKGKTETFTIHKIPQYDTIKYISVYSKSNKYNKGIPYSTEEKDRRFLPMNPNKDIHVDNEAIKQIVYTVLGHKMDALKKNKEIMRFIFEFEPDGKITDIGFTLKENTLITSEEIEEIDQKLRHNIKATFTGTQYKYYIAINYNKPYIEF